MKKQLLFSILMAGAVGISGCNIKSSDEINKDFQRKLNEDRKKNDEMMAELNKSFERGGQPGNIKVSGVIVKDNAKTDVRITVIAKGGVSKDGTEAIIGEKFKPVLSGKNEQIDLSYLTKKTSLLAVGCDEKNLSSYTKGTNLEVQKLPDPISKDAMIVSAKLVILCGNIEDLNYGLLHVSADELILDSLDFTQVGMTGSITFSANKLVLMGSNRIMTKGIDSVMVISLVPSIELNVMKEISSTEDGKLLLMSSGANYKAEVK